MWETASSMSNTELAFELIRELDINRLWVRCGIKLDSGRMRGLNDLIAEWDRRKALGIM